MKSANLKYLLLFLTGFLALHTHAQLPASAVFSVAGNNVSVEEFERQFLKSLPRTSDSISAKDLDEYLKMYIDFKLKYQDAKDAGLDSSASYQSELAGYRRDLARNYLFDKEVTESLIKEAYDRWQYDVRVSHILVYLKEDATPKDTLEAFKKIHGFSDQLTKDPGLFETIAKNNSEDPGTAPNGGDLGYFTVFQVVYPFESMAYNTPVGEISKVFRTQFGYHILKVTSKRPNRGEIKVRRIALKVGNKPESTEEAVKAKIEEIYNKIKSGEATFEGMAKSYSEDYNSRYNGGEMDYFSATQKVGDIDFQEWAEKAYELKTNGEMSKPFRTNSGWHLVQRMDLKPLGNFSQLRLVIKNQVQSDMRAQKSVDALIEKVKSENQFQEFKSAYNALYSSLDTNFKKGVFKRSSLPKMAPKQKPQAPIKGNVFVEASTDNAPLETLLMFTLAGEKHDVGEFAEFIESTIKPYTTTPEEAFKALYNDWVGGQCVDYQDRHLEEKNQEFKYLYQEYREGILMFNRMQEKVWDKANTDSVGLAKYFDAHRNEYPWKDRFDCQVYICASEAIMKSVTKQVKKNINADTIRKYENAVKPLNMDYRMGKYEITDSFLFPDNRILEKLFADPKYRKAGKIIKMGQIGSDWVVVKVNQFIPAGPKLLEETRGPVAAKYQDYLEKQWIESLRAKYTVQINEQAMAALKAKLVNN